MKKGFILFSIILLCNLFMFSQNEVTETVSDTSKIFSFDYENEEEITIALGVKKKKKSLGYVLSTLDCNEVDRVKYENIINSLSGKVAGLQILNNTNISGSSNILLRGSSSIFGNNQVLFIVDGIPVNSNNSNSIDQIHGRGSYDYGNLVADINPNNIQSVSVLKGPVASALYGSRGANGVIIITSKKSRRSKDEKIRINVGFDHSTLLSFLDKSTFPKYQTNYGQGYGPYNSVGEHPGLLYYDMDGDGINDFVEPVYEDASMGSKFDPSLMIFNWASMYPESPTYMQKVPYEPGTEGPDYFFSTGIKLLNSININLGAKSADFRLGYTNIFSAGMIPNNSMKKHCINFNGSIDIYEKLTVSIYTNYISAYNLGRNGTGFGGNNIMTMFRQNFNLGVDLALQEEYYDLSGINMTWNPNDDMNLSPAYWDNPYWVRYKNFQSDERDRILGMTQVDWEIADFLKFRGRTSIDRYNFIQEERKEIGSVAGSMGVGSIDVGSGYAIKEIFFKEMNFDAMLIFNKNFNQKVNLDALIGTNIQRTTFEETLNSTQGGLENPGIFSLANSLNPLELPEQEFYQIGVNGYFFSLSVGIKELFFINGAYRYDMPPALLSSKWSKGYPSLNLSFLFSEVLNFNWLNLGKLRLGYAQTGNNVPNSLLNSFELKPEQSESFEGGLELSIFKERLSFDFTVYKEITGNQIFSIVVSSATGLRSEMINIGEIENKGIELFLRAKPFKKKNFNWDLSLNWSKNLNKVIELREGYDRIQISKFSSSGVTLNVLKGEPLGVLSGTDFIYHNGQRVVQPNGYYAVTATSDHIIGNVQPDWNAGILNTLSYKAFSLSFLIDLQMGGSIYSLDQAFGMGAGLYAETDFINDLGNPVRNSIADGGGLILEGVLGVDENGDGDYESYTTNNVRIDADNYSVFGWVRNPNAAFIFDATYVKLREISLSYSLPKKKLEKIFINDASISIIGSNLWILYKTMPHADPEASQGAGNIRGWQSGVFPRARNIGFNINLMF